MMLLPAPISRSSYPGIPSVVSDWPDEAFAIKIPAPGQVRRNNYETYLHCRIETCKGYRGFRGPAGYPCVHCGSAIAIPAAVDFGEIE